MTFEDNLSKILQNDYYKNSYFQIKEDILYSFMQKTTKHQRYLPEEVLNIVRNEYDYNVKNFINDDKLALADKLATKELIAFYICHKYLNLSYEDFKYIKQTDISEIDFYDKELEDFITNVKKIQNGIYEVYAHEISNPKSRLLAEFQKEMNGKINSYNNFTNMTADQLKNEYDFDLPLNIQIKNPGYNFTLLIKSMNFLGRSADAYTEKWNTDEIKFPYDSRSIVSNSMFNVAISSTQRSDMWWIVGFNEINHLYDASSADLDNKTINGKLQTYLKPGKNVKNLCSTNQLLSTSGVIDDNNNSIFYYNEVVCDKYNKNGDKYQPDYIIYPISSNPKAQFSKSVRERFEVATKAAQDFNIPIVFIDLDKIAKHEKEEIDKKIENYKNNPSDKLLIEILRRIRMNRSTDYAADLFPNSYISQFVVDCCNANNKNIFEEIIDIMPNYSFKTLQSALENYKRGLDNNIKSEIDEYNSFEEMQDKISKQELDEIEELKRRIFILEKKLFKTKKVKREKDSLLLQLDIHKKNLLENENKKIRTKKEKNKQDKEKIDFLFSLSYDKKIDEPIIEEKIKITVTSEFLKNQNLNDYQTLCNEMENQDLLNQELLEELDEKKLS